MDPPYDYLSENDEFYRRFWADEPLYRERCPNVEEAARLGAIVRMSSLLFESGRLDPKKARILDVGCGRGWLTQSMSVYGHCEGCEPSEQGIHSARELFPGLKFHHGTVTQLLSEPDFSAYDLVVSSEVLEHVPWSHKSTFLQELAAAVKPGGHLILTTPRQELWASCGDSSSQLIEQWVTEKQMLELSGEVGFEPVQQARAFPTASRWADRFLRRARRLGRVFGLSLELNALQRGLDYKSSLYQIWCFKKR